MSEIQEKLEKLDNKVDQLVSGEMIEKPVDVHQVAKYLDVKDVRTVYRYMNELGLPHHKAGNLTRFYLSEIKTWLQKQ